VVAGIILRRPLVAEAQTANRLFATWWIGLAFVSLASGPYGIALALGFRDLAFATAYLNAILVALCVALWGILGFLVFVYKGSNRWVVPIGIGYGLLAFAMLWLVAWMGPSGFEPDGRMLFDRKLGASGMVIVSLVFSVPVFAAALAYASLLFRIPERLPRYRIGLVSGAFALRFGWTILSSLLGLQRRFPDSKVLLVANQAAGLLLPIMILLAYRPPAWIAARLAQPTAGA
jgi:hypothetical protein